jgi:uncharacterized protein YchJ
MAARVSFEWAWNQFARAAHKLQSLFVRTKEKWAFTCGFAPAHPFGATPFFNSDQDNFD